MVNSLQIIKNKRIFKILIFNNNNKTFLCTICNINLLSEPSFYSFNSKSMNWHVIIDDAVLLKIR